MLTDTQIIEAITAEAERLGRAPGGYSVRRYCREVYGQDVSDIRVKALLSTLELEFEAEEPKAEPQQEPEPSFEDDLEAGLQSAELDRLRKRVKALEREYDKALEAAVLTERLARDVIQAAPVSYKPLTPALPKRPKSGTPESYMLMFSDSHVGQVIDPGQTLGMGEYNLEIFLDRLAYLEQAASSIITEHTASPIEELVVAFLGDILHGALAHSNEADQLVTAFDQWYIAGHAIAQFLRNLARYVPKVRVYGVVGNHGRLPHQKKMPTLNRFSNFDHFAYHYIEALTLGVPNIEWHLDRQPFALFEVQGWVFHAGHGDHLKGGDKALGLPAHAIGRQVNTGTQLFVRSGLRPPQYYLFGDKHKRFEIPHGLGEVVFNGCFPGVDNYSLASNFTPVDPVQQLFKVHPKYGRQGIYPIKLQFAPRGLGEHYLSTFDFG